MGAVGQTCEGVVHGLVLERLGQAHQRMSHVLKIACQIIHFRHVAFYIERVVKVPRCNQPGGLAHPDQ